MADIIKGARTKKVQLEIPEGFPLDEEDLRKYADQSIDFRGINGEDGLSFSQITAFFAANEDTIGSNDLLANPEYAKQMFGIINEANEAGMTDDRIYLETFRSLQQKVSCVYGVIKDKAHKQIIVTFRGSQNPDFSTRDWRTNINARLADLKTPSLVKDKMEGKLKERILVHEGFYQYLFDNKRIRGDQRFDKIISTIKELLNGEEGYSVHVTGHSLGGALATLFAFKLAGKNDEWLPRPVTCISYASPRLGTSGFRIAHEQLERDGLLRHLRVTNDNDLVPTLPTTTMFTILSRRRRFKHAGINLRLKNKGFDIIHTSKLSGIERLKNSLENSPFKPFWAFLKYHMLPLHNERMDKYKDELSNVTIADLYKDESVVGGSFKIE